MYFPDNPQHVNDYFRIKFLTKLQIFDCKTNFLIIYRPEIEKTLVTQQIYENGKIYFRINFSDQAGLKSNLITCKI